MVVSAAVLALFNTPALGIHASALQPVHTGHSAGTSHQASPAVCLTVCTAVTLNRDKATDETEEDDTPQPPFYIQIQTSPLAALEEKHSEEARLAADREPPPGGSPAYIGLTVFRA